MSDQWFGVHSWRAPWLSVSTGSATGSAARRRGLHGCLCLRVPMLTWIAETSMCSAARHRGGWGDLMEGSKFVCIYVGVYVFDHK